MHAMFSVHFVFIGFLKSAVRQALARQAEGSHRGVVGNQCTDACVGCPRPCGVDRLVVHDGREYRVAP